MFSNVLKVVRFVTIGCAAIALSVLSAHAQTSANTTTNLKSPAKAEQAAAQHKNAREEQLLTDWPDLAKYREADAAFPPPAPGEDRVVFMGDSITQIWPFHAEYPVAYPLAKDSEFFPGKPYINRGISGQTTPQMLVRFRQDVIDLHPRVVVILAGTNDLAGNTGPESIEDIEGNLKSMSDLAHANGIRVVLCSILPAFDYPWRPGIEPSPKIVALNQWMKSYAAEKGDVYVDYYAAMVDARGGLPSSISIDGVHPNKAGFEIMAPLAEAGIEQALRAPTPSASASTGCNPIPGASQLWSNPSTRYILVGEMHGTQEHPAIFGDLVCAAADSGREIIVGLERPTSEQPEIDVLLDSKNPTQATSELLKKPMWSTLDGRSSQAMVMLLDRLRTYKASGKVKEVIAFDAGVNDESAARDRKMGNFLQGVASRNPNALILVLTGNLHPLKAAMKEFGYPFMGMFLPADQVKSLLVIDKGGTAWLWMKNGCDVHSLPSTNGTERGVFLDPKRAPAWAPVFGYDGVLSTGKSITASLPAIPNPPKPPACVAHE